VRQITFAGVWLPVYASFLRGGSPTPPLRLLGCKISAERLLEQPASVAYTLSADALPKYRKWVSLDRTLLAERSSLQLPGVPFL
jgi:hypothetical protein